MEGLSAEQFLASVGKFITWIYLGAHQLSLTVGTGNQADSIALLTAFDEAGGIITPFYYQLIPVILLLYSGYQLAGITPEYPPKLGAIRGAFVAGGYSPIVFLAASVATIEQGPITIEYDPVAAATMAVIYGVVFGGIGGIVGGAIIKPANNSTQENGTG